MYCPNCQEPIEYGDAFCGNCGIALQIANRSAQSPPGWYADPAAPGSGRLRYWDGNQWTPYTHPPEVWRQ
ncbi:MAG: DUF2510 domain-containing protein [Candidatus Dormibacteria bacterium]